MRDARTQGALAQVAARAVETPGPYAVPGLVALIDRADGSIDQLAVGTDAAGTALTIDTLFPLASTSKLAVGLLVLRLIDDGQVGLDDVIGRYVEGAAAGDSRVTVRTLLSHTSGLPLDLPTDLISYGGALGVRDLADACRATPLQYTPGSIVQYSNVGYGLLATLVERVTGEAFWTAMRRHVLTPLAIDAHPANDLPREPARLADVRSTFTGTPYEPVNSAYWRSLAPPWAGLFGTARALLSLSQAYGDASTLVSAPLLAAARTDQTGGVGGGFTTTDPVFGFGPSGKISWARCAWGLGVEVRGDKAPHWTPPRTSRDSFGHLGSSGCLAWCDPAHGASWSMLAPRTTDSGWQLRYAPQIGTIALSHPPAT